MKWTQNNRQTDEEKSYYVWDLKEGRKRIAQVFVHHQNFKPDGKMICICEAFCFLKRKPEHQTIEEFKEEIKEYFENYLKG